MWKSINYEVCGRSHSQSSTPCQDKTKACTINAVKIIALADGAGSQPLSHFGAAVVTDSICQYLAQHFDRLLGDPDGKQAKKDILAHLLGRLRVKSEKLSCNIRELASTLLAVAVKGNMFLMLHIGDGVIGCLKNKELKVVSDPENGEFANTTSFVTSREAIYVMKLFKGSTTDIAGFVLMSDGTAESLYHKKHNKFAHVLFKLMHRTAILDSDKMYEFIKESFDRVLVLNTQDDCSIALLCRQKGPLCKYADMTLGQKCDLLNITAYDRAAKRRVKRFDDIMYYLEEGKTLKQLSKLLYLKEKYTRRHLKRLEGLGLVSRKGKTYSKIVTA
ncbi:MAG: ArsR family transcriptional regulator [Firmicutes bacterium]|nr:ArsR family transcriptional regulator [Bacillota bacterium]